MSDIWLAHHGIKDQKWGVRRFQNKDGSLTPAGKQRYGIGDMTPDREKKNNFRDRMLGRGKYQPGADNPINKVREKALDISKPISSSIEKSRRNKDYDKNRSNMSDKDLDAAINRLKKEKQLHEMIHPGRTYAKEIIKNVGQRVLTTAAIGVALYAGKQFAAEVLSNPELGNAIFNGGPKKK